MPSFMRAADGLRDKGVDEILCVAVNDPFVLDAWGKSTGGTEAGIRIVGDLTAEFTKAIGMAFSNPARGFVDRSKRYSMLVDDGVVKALNVEESPGSCEISAGETLLAAM
jgi:cytochrome c peroxidase